MFVNYLIVAVRNLLRHKLYTLINILGLSVGTACCLLMVLYVVDDLMYDQQYENSHRIFRVLRTAETEKGSVFEWSTSGALAPALQQDFPEVENTTRLFTDWASSIRFNDNQLSGLFCFADPTILEMFNLPLIKGDPNTALRVPGGIVLTEEMAHKFFGRDTDPIGQSITIDCDWVKANFTVTGILKDFSHQSSFWFDVLFSPYSIPDRGYLQKMIKKWATESGYRIAFRTYVQLPEGYDYKTLEQKLQSFIIQHMGTEESKRTTYRLQPLNRIHLYGKTDFGLTDTPSGAAQPVDISQLMLFSALAFFILLIACVNFTNLTTARSLHRLKEIGVRKVVGAHRRQLVKQFLGESFILSFFSLILCFVFAEICLPEFNMLVQKNLSLALNPVFTIIGALSFFILVGILAGSYPAIFLSRFSPIEALKNQGYTGRHGNRFRNGLVIFQFSLSVILIISTTVVHNQLRYMTNGNLGLNIDHLIDIPIFGSNSALRKNPEMVKAEFSQYNGVVSLSAISGWPGGLPGDAVVTVYPDGQLNQEFESHFIGGDTGLLDVYQIQLVAGRNISADGVNEVLLNETAVKQLGWTDPIGKTWTWKNPVHDSETKIGTVVGVVEDFHFQTMDNKIKPLFIGPADQLFTLLVRVRPEHISQTIASLKTSWEKLVPEKKFAYGFETAHFESRFYQKERQIGHIAQYASVLAIFIACLGLLGLAASTTERRTKEIGIRKILGASANRIVRLLAADFLKLVIVANAIAWPVAYWVMSNWLKNYAYRIGLGFGTFLISGGFALLIALLTVSFQAWKAASANPVDSLRNE